MVEGKLYFCVGCKKVCEKIQIDHIVPCGSIEDLNGFKERLFCSAQGLRALCAACHRRVTNEARAKKEH